MFLTKIILETHLFIKHISRSLQKFRQKFYIPLSTFSSNIFFFIDLFLSTPWVQSNLFLPIMIKCIPMNSICFGRSFTLTYSNNNLWVSMSIYEILKTKSIAKYSKVLQIHDCYHVSNQCPLFGPPNTLRLAGS